MSKNEKNISDHKGPDKFYKEEIINYFETNFDIKNSKETVYHGTLIVTKNTLFYNEKVSEALT